MRGSLNTIEPGREIVEPQPMSDATLERAGLPANPKPDARAVVPAVHEAVIVPRVTDFSSLDVVIDETRKDLEALERVKEIMARQE